MTTALLDTSTLIALLDPSHTFHAAVAKWFRSHADQSWATCPLTQNGFVRIVSHPSYPQSIAVGDAIASMRTVCSHAKHSFWADDITVADKTVFDHDHLLSSGQVTDTYLLGLAARHDGCLVTLDRRIDIATVRAATAANLLVLDPRA
ncbi:MAG: hypothetical protein FWD63_04985 [Propionibacteriaceae bacterium]|nr:hypothetical protein [Propionibacteriaceae bacterium]